MLSSSYSSYYRRMLPKLLAALEFRCNNTAHRPVMDALQLLRRYADRSTRVKQYDVEDRVPLDNVVRPDWRGAVINEHGRVERIPLQSALVHLNTILLQRDLEDSEWADRLTLEDRRALSPLFWSHVNPYGRFTLDMGSRLDLGAASAAPPEVAVLPGDIEVTGVKVERAPVPV